MTQVEQVTPNCNQIAYNHALHSIHIDPEAYSYTSPVRGTRPSGSAHALLILILAVTHARSR